MVKNRIKWFWQQVEKVWQGCRRGHVIIIPTNQTKKLPPSLRKEIEKQGYLGPANKVGLFASRKVAFQVGFLEGWGLAITTEEGYKWAKYHHNKRQRSKGEVKR